MVSDTLPAGAVSRRKRRGTASKAPRGYRSQNSATRPASRWTLRLIAVAYLFFLLMVPVGLVFWRTFEHGAGVVWDSLTTPAAIHAIQITAETAGIATICNTVFGVGMALLLVRHRFWGRRLLNSLIDLSIAVSPVVVGLSLVLIYGRFEPVGRWLDNHGVQVIFALPGMVLATIFVSLPLVVRAVAPVIEEIGTDQEQAAYTLGASRWQGFWRITLPAIRWALAYGVVLSLARALGEFGAVAVVSGNLEGQTQTLTLFVQEHFQNFDAVGAYSAAFLLALIAIVALIVISLLRPKEDS
ncbi:MAG TPA: sulfate ABC transporter permease subunit [Frankiaceae bacterium]|nr:sulfate ABC transporter permease subunit [Frankiaceae bacterium]